MGLTLRFRFLKLPSTLRFRKELCDGEYDVKSIQAVLGITHSGVSQHLMTFRAHRLVSECGRSSTACGNPSWLLG